MNRNFIPTVWDLLISKEEWKKAGLRLRKDIENDKTILWIRLAAQ